MFWLLFLQLDVKVEKLGNLGVNQTILIDTYTFRYQSLFLRAILTFYARSSTYYLELKPKKRTQAILKACALSLLLSINPIRMERTFFINTLIRVRTKVVTLCLQQVRWKLGCTVAVVISKGT
ncbi:hypothetical protein SAMN05421677_10360 [Halobacillus aidingensis]|uniref:Uncharacterized protein n=1 Tax=Halobacillus aidingensis TaxID=240303 RepID=A0A1H0H5K8_HALAD|nr:hypothetical protein SAMN05421677_10360 [Halobacillus aidingensis]